MKHERVEPPCMERNLVSMPIEQNIPTNYEAEEGVIACLLFNWRNIVKIADRLRPAHFHDDKLATIYSCILDLYQRGQRPTIPSVADEWARRTVQPLEIRQMSWELEQYTTSIATLHGVDAYVDSVIRVSQHRRLLQACARIAEAAYHQAENSLQIAEEAIMAVALDGDLKGLTPFGTALDAYLAHYEQRRAEVAEGKSIGVKTGLTTIDALLGGFRPGTLSILAARTSIGKTSLALNIALTIAKQALSGGGEVAFFSLEMQQDELVQRLLAIDVPID
jgi:replicative DNA helicase